MTLGLSTYAGVGFSESPTLLQQTPMSSLVQPALGVLVRVHRRFCVSLPTILQQVSS